MTLFIYLHCVIWISLLTACCSTTGEHCIQLAFLLSLPATCQKVFFIDWKYIYKYITFLFRCHLTLVILLFIIFFIQFICILVDTYLLQN